MNPASRAAVGIPSTSLTAATMRRASDSKMVLASTHPLALTMERPSFFQGSGWCCSLPRAAMALPPRTTTAVFSRAASGSTNVSKKSRSGVSPSRSGTASGTLRYGSVKALTRNTAICPRVFGFVGQYNGTGTD